MNHHSEVGKTPNIRFQGFEDSWNKTPLNKILSNSKDKNIELKYSKNDVLSVSGKLGVLNQIKHLGRSYAGKSVHNYGILRQGEFVYTKSPLKENPFGIIKLNRGSTGIVSTLYAIYVGNKSTIDNDFLDYYFSLDDNVNRYLRPLVRKGAKNDMKINNEYVLNDSIYIPSTHEQKKIASFLLLINSKIEKLTRKKELLEEYKKGVMQKLFSGEIRFKDENGDNYPDWIAKLYGDVYSFHFTNSFSRDKLNYENGEVFNIHYGDIHTKFSTNFDLTRESVPRIDIEIDLSKFSEQVYCQEGDLVIADASEDYADIGKTIELINLNNERILAGLHTFLARPNKYPMEKGFAGYLMQSWDVRKQVMVIAQGTKVLGISKSRLSKIKIVIPSSGEQKKIALLLSSIDSKIEQVSFQIKKTKEFQKGLLQQMFV